MLKVNKMLQKGKLINELNRMIYELEVLRKSMTNEQTINAYLYAKLAIKKLIQRVEEKEN